MAPVQPKAWLCKNPLHAHLPAQCQGHQCPGTGTVQGSARARLLLLPTPTWLLATVPQRTRSEEEGDALGQHPEEAKFSPRAAPVHVSVRERGRGRAGPG